MAGSGVPMSEQLNRSLRVLRRRWRVLAFVPLVALVVSLIVSSGSPSQYSATSKVVISPYNPVTALLNPGSSPTSADPERDLNTEVSEITETPMADRVRHRLKLTESSPALLGEVSAGLEGTTNIVDITVVDENPAVAARVANAFSSEFVGFRLDELRSALAQSAAADQEKLLTLGATQRASAAGRQLQDDVTTLQADIDGLTSDARVSETATVPTSTVSPRPLTDALIALIAGFLVAVTAVVILELLDRSVRDEREALAVTRLPSLGSIPRQRSRFVALAAGAVLERQARDGHDSVEPWLPLAATGGSRAKRRVEPKRDGLAQQLRTRISSVAARASELTGDNELDESFGALAVSLLAQQRGPQENVVMITSPGPQDGKTSVAIGLAAALAELGQRVTLVECDLRRPRFAECLHLSSPDEGLSTILTGESKLPSGLVEVVAATREAGSPRPPRTVSARRLRGRLAQRATHSFTMLPCGPVPAKPLTLLRGPELASVIHRLQSSADVVLIDTPPLGAIKDAAVVSGSVDQVAIVARVGHTRREALLNCLEEIQPLAVPILGLVTVGGQRGGALDYYFRPEFNRPRGRDREPRLIALGEPPAPIDSDQDSPDEAATVRATGSKPTRSRRRASSGT